MTTMLMGARSSYKPSPSQSCMCLQVRPNILELQLQGKRKVNPHYLESYRTALQAAMLLPFGRRGTPRDRAGVLSLGQQPVLRAILAAEGCAAALSHASACMPFLCRGSLLLKWCLLMPAPLHPVGFASTGLLLNRFSGQQVANCQWLWQSMPLCLCIILSRAGHAGWIGR